MLFDFAIPDEHHQDEGVKKIKPRIVLYWKDDGLVNLYDMGLGSKCNNRCLFTSDRSQLPEADAVIVEKNLYPNWKFPKRHNNRQIFVASRYEAPSKLGNYSALYKTLSSPTARNYFNLTLSYRQDSDVVIKYHNVLPGKGEDEDLNLPKNKPRKQVVWVVSNCDTPIKREKVARRLQDYNVSVDIYGHCGRSLLDTCSHKDSKNRTGKDPLCLQKIVKNYKFYIAFENSLCDDYLTEKAAQFMDIPSLPIVMSYAKLDRFLPPKSYINVFNFTTIKQLADYILYLDNNFDEYIKYFSWRKRWKIETFLKVRPRVKCDLCDLLHTEYSKMYENLADWFAAPGLCSLDGLQKHFSDFTD